MCSTGRTLDEFMSQGAPGVVALAHFHAHLGVDSATYRASVGMPDVAEWSADLKQSVILADIFDVLNALNTNVAHIGSKKRAKRPKPYPRPWRKEGTVLGKAAVKIKDFWDWWTDKED